MFWNADVWRLLYANSCFTSALWFRWMCHLKWTFVLSDSQLWYKLGNLKRTDLWVCTYIVLQCCKTWNSAIHGTEERSEIQIYFAECRHLLGHLSELNFCSDFVMRVIFTVYMLISVRLPLKSWQLRTISQDTRRTMSTKIQLNFLPFWIYWVRVFFWIPGAQIRVFSYIFCSFPHSLRTNSGIDLELIPQQSRPMHKQRMW